MKTATFVFLALAIVAGAYATVAPAEAAMYLKATVMAATGLAGLCHQYVSGSAPEINSKEEVPHV